MVHRSCRTPEVFGFVYGSYVRSLFGLGYRAFFFLLPSPFFFLSTHSPNHPKMDDLILRKVNESDASVFAKRYGETPSPYPRTFFPNYLLLKKGGSSKFWGVIWCIVSILFMACGIIVSSFLISKHSGEIMSDHHSKGGIGLL